MIYGLIPIGGKGTRLALPFSKEMLPQKNFDFYNPLVNHVVEKMQLAGAEKVVFIHGNEYKQDVINFFTDSMYVHVLQQSLGFANVLKDFYNSINPEDTDKVLFGLPDSVFSTNPFIELLNSPGITCGLFKTDNWSKVDRLIVGKQEFDVKSSKTSYNSDWFWGVIKFDGIDLRQMVGDAIFSSYSEIGKILNKYPFTTINCSNYLDLGTWANYNRYLTDTEIVSNNEIEKKYDASLIDIEEFKTYCTKLNADCIDITSTDYYFTNDNSAIEFIRYREKSPTNVKGDLTIKNFNTSQLNRFELVIPLDECVNTHNVMHFLSLLNATFIFKVTKTCYIYTTSEYTLVLYTFVIKDKEFKILEIELHKIDFNLIHELEHDMKSIPGFDPGKTISKSKFQLINEYLNDSTQ